MLQRLQETMTTQQMIITDPYMIQYFIGTHYEVGERMLALYVSKNNEATLILNKLFKAPTTLKCIHYDDTDNPVQKLIEIMNPNESLALDGHMPFRFVLPLLEVGFKPQSAAIVLESLRRIKTPDEITKMKIASKSNDAIMAQMRDAIKLGMSEIELSQIALKLHNQTPQSGISFDPIVVFTENIADPHGVPSNRSLKEGDVVLIDMGGMLNGYASDMTRCFFTAPNNAMKKIYDIVLQANEAAIQAVKIGATLASVDKAARDVIINAGYGPYFIHRTGHGIGIECHENLDVSSANQTIIENGMCFSIEPGIYIEGLGGIRIEDLVCVENDAVSVLNHYPKQFEDILLQQ